MRGTLYMDGVNAALPSDLSAADYATALDKIKLDPETNFLNEPGRKNLITACSSSPGYTEGVPGIFLPE